MLVTYDFSVELHCESCKEGVQRALAELPYIVKRPYVNVSRKRVKITVDESVDAQGQQENLKQELQDALTSAGFQLTETNEENDWILAGVGIVGGLSLLALSLIFPGGLPFIATASLGFLTSVINFIYGFPSYNRAIAEFRKDYTLNMDTLLTLSTLSMVVMMVLGIFYPSLSMMLDFDSIWFVWGFHKLSIAIRNKLMRNTELSEAFEDLLPVNVHYLSAEGEVQSKALTAVKPGDVLRVAAGDIIPADAICRKRCRVNQNLISGFSRVVVVEPGARLLSGMILMEETDIEVIETPEQSYLASYYRMVDQPESENESFREKNEVIDQLLNYFIPVVFALALISGVGMGFVSPILGFKTAMTVLLGACPCMISIVPILFQKKAMELAAVLSGMRFKDPDALNLFKAEKIVFDFRGTLTMGLPEVLNVVPHDPSSFSLEDLFLHLWTIEQQADHTIAQAIREDAEQRGLNDRALTLPIEDLDQEDHRGLRAKIGNQWFILGNQGFLQAHGIEWALQLDECETAVFLVREADQKRLGHVILKDRVRPDVEQTFRALEQRGIDIFICTGERAEVVKPWLRQWGLAENKLRADCVAQLKSQFLQELEADGSVVAMVGDGRNDALAMANRPSIAMRNYLNKNVLDASVEIEGESLFAVAKVFDLREKLSDYTTQTLVGCFIYNLVTTSAMGGLLYLALGLVCSPSVGPLLMVLLCAGPAFKLWQFEDELQNELPLPLQEFNSGPEELGTYSHLASMGLQPQHENDLDCQDQDNKLSQRSFSLLQRREILPVLVTKGHVNNDTLNFR